VPTLDLMFGRRLGLIVLLALLGSASVGASASLADTAPLQWQPTTSDLARAVRPCPAQVAAVAPPVCWSETQDTTAWMAQPVGSPYPWGQCTYYVGLMRPDIWDDRAPPSVDSLDDWDAWTWAAHAQAEGLPVDGNPRAGDVMVYSRGAVGNDTGHVAMVDSVGGTEPATGDLRITVSEMNLEGLDNAALGQGDTMTVALPRSELVPGMVQFIHRPAPGYSVPAWPSGWSAGTAKGPTDGQWATEQNPSLGVGAWADRVATVSQSPAPMSATVTRDGTVVTRLRVAANRVVPLGLPTGTYTVCVSQPATTGWDAASGCASAGWRAPVTAIVTLGRPHTARRGLALPVLLGPQLPLSIAAKGSPVTAVVRIQLHRALGRGRGAAASSRTIYTRAWRLRAGSQVLTLPLAGAVTRHAVLQVTVVVRGTGAIRVGAGQTSVRVG